MLNQLRRSTNYIMILLLLSGVLFSYSMIPEFVKPLNATELTDEILLRILSLELPELQLTEWDKKNNILKFIYASETVSISVYGPIENDLDEDGRNEVILGCEFLNRWETRWELDNKDVLWIYKIGENGVLQQLSTKHFTPQDTGQFEDIHIGDVTGEGLAEISIRYRAAYAGARSWGWKDNLYIIRGHSPFDLLLELKVLEIAENVNKGEYNMKTDVDITDMDADGINEIVTVQYEGEDESNLVQVTSQPLIYRVSFKLTPHALEHLRNQGIPDEVLQELESLEEQEIATKGEFLSAVEQQIGKEETEKYERLFVQYAIYRYGLKGELQ